MTTIDYFGTGTDAGDHSFLSNFYVIDEDGTTVEHLYQAAKTLDLDWKKRILDAPTPGAAKKLGRQAPMRPDWDDIKISIMGQLLRQVKFMPDSSLAQQLLDTEDAQLVEGNYWGDTFWGVCRGEGQNWLGRLLMQVRDERRHGPTRFGDCDNCGAHLANEGHDFGGPVICDDCNMRHDQRMFPQPSDSEQDDRLW